MLTTQGIAEENRALQLLAFCDYFMLNKFSEVAKTEGFINLSPQMKQTIEKRHSVIGPSQNPSWCIKTTSFNIVTESKGGCGQQ